MPRGSHCYICTYAEWCKQPAISQPATAQHRRVRTMVLRTGPSAIMHIRWITHRLRLNVFVFFSTLVLVSIVCVAVDAEALPAATAPAKAPKTSPNKNPPKVFGLSNEGVACLKQVLRDTAHSVIKMATGTGPWATGISLIKLA
jgi:hypothetical protein